MSSQKWWWQFTILAKNIERYLSLFIFLAGIDLLPGHGSVEMGGILSNKLDTNQMPEAGY